LSLKGHGPGSPKGLPGYFLLTKRDFSGSLKIGNVLNVKSCPNIRKGSVDRGVPSAVRMSFLVRRFFMTLA